MGTRGAVGYFGRLNGENMHKVTYNHFDSYPSHLGIEVVKYIQSRDGDVNSIKDDFKGIKLVENTDDNYSKQRSCQGDLASYAFHEKMIDNQDFLNDSLWCEWAYIINCNTGKLEIYRGFQEDQSKVKGRYKDKTYESGSGTTYYGVSLIKSIPLEDVTTDIMYELEETEYAD